MGLGLAALGGLAKGIGQGMQYADYMNEKQLERDRLAKKDARDEQMFNEQMDVIRDARQQRENQQAIDKYISDAGKSGQVENAAAVTYTNPAGEQKTAYQPDQQTADFAAQQQRLEENEQPVAPATPSNPTVTEATSVRDMNGNRKLFTGLNAAADAKSFSDQNQPGSYAQYMGMRNKLIGMLGGQKAADDYLTRAKEAQREGVFDTLLALKSNNPNTDAAKKIFNSTGTYRMADNQEFAKDVGADGKPTGKWNVVEAQPDGSSKVVIPDVESYAINRIRGSAGIIEDAKARTAAQIKLQEDIAKERAKGHVIPAGGQFVPGFGDPRPSFNNTNRMVNIGTDESPIWVDSRSPAAGGGGARTSGAGGNGKLPLAGIDEATKLISNYKLDNEGQKSTAIGYLPAIFSADPTLSAQKAQQIAVDAATNPAAITPSVNSQTGELTYVYKNPKVAKGSYDLGAGGIDAMPDNDELKNVKMPQQVGQMMAGQANDATRKAIRDSAASPDVLKKNVEFIRSVGAQNGDDQATIENNVANFQRKVSLYSNFNPDKRSTSFLDVVKSAFGGGGSQQSAVKAIKQPGGLPGAAPSAPTIADKFRAEDDEMVRGTRLRYSPDVQKYYDDLQKQKQEQDRADNAAYLEKVRQREIRRSKEIAASMRQSTQ